MQRSPASSEETDDIEEVQLSMTFGEDLSTEAFRAFYTHYHQVFNANISRGVGKWLDPMQRTNALREALRARATIFIDSQIPSHSVDAEGGRVQPFRFGTSRGWIDSDIEILTSLEQRFSCVPVEVLRFEEARQRPQELLEDFMFRLLELADDAFALEPELICRQRVLWRFVVGLNDADLSERLKGERWLEFGPPGALMQYDHMLQLAQSIRQLRNISIDAGQDHPSSDDADDQEAAPPGDAVMKDDTLTATPAVTTASSTASATATPPVLASRYLGATRFYQRASTSRARAAHPGTRIPLARTVLPDAAIPMTRACLPGDPSPVAPAAARPRVGPDAMARRDAPSSSQPSVRSVLMQPTLMYRNCATRYEPAQLDLLTPQTLYRLRDNKEWFMFASSNL